MMFKMLLSSKASKIQCLSSIMYFSILSLWTTDLFHASSVKGASVFFDYFLGFSVFYMLANGAMIVFYSKFP